MARENGRSKRRAPDVKGPLALSAALGIVAFAVTSVVGAGGTDTGPRLDLGLIIGGIAFIASVVVCATLMMIDKPNDPSLGQGTGVNRSSARIYAQKRATRQARDRQRGETGAADGRTAADGRATGDGAKPTGPEGRPGPRDDDSGPQFGQRIHPEQ